MSDAGVAAVRGLVTVDVEQRLSLLELCASPWLADFPPAQALLEQVRLAPRPDKAKRTASKLRTPEAC